MIGDRHRAVADARREHLRQQRRDRAIGQARQRHQPEDAEQDQRTSARRRARSRAGVAPLPAAAADQPEQRKQQDQRQRIARHDRRLAPDPVGQRAGDEVEDQPDQRAGRDDQLRRRLVHVHRRRAGSASTENSAVYQITVSPARDAEQRDEQPLEVAGIGEAFLERIGRCLARGLIALNTGLSDSLSRIHSDTASSSSENRNGKRHPSRPTPRRDQLPWSPARPRG